VINLELIAGELIMTYATFVTGLQKPIAKWLEEEGHKVRRMLDGAILFDEKRKPPPCFFNTFDILHQEKATIEQLMKKVQKTPLRFGRSKGKTFRIVTSKENQLIAVDKKLRSDVEKLIASRTGLIPERRGGGREFWFLSRSEGITLFMERRPSPPEPKLKKGELRPQLAYCLNRLAGPTPKDIMLDPFSGHGAIPRARAKYFPSKKIHSLDKDPGIHRIPAIFAAQSIDVIVTDPPWGAYDKHGDIPTIYADLAKAANHVMRPGGRVVILSAQKELIHNQLAKDVWSNAKLEENYDILVSGQKAGVFLIKFREELR